MGCKLMLMTMTIVTLVTLGETRRIGHCGLKCFRWRKCMGQLGDGENRPGQLGDTGQIVLKTCNAGRCDCAKVLAEQEAARKEKKEGNTTNNNNTHNTHDKDKEDDEDERRRATFGSRGRRFRNRSRFLSRTRSGHDSEDDDDAQLQEDKAKEKAVWADSLDEGTSERSDRLRSAGIRSRFLSFRHTAAGVKTSLVNEKEAEVEKEDEVEKEAEVEKATEVEKRKTDLRRLLSERIRRRY